MQVIHGVAPLQDQLGVADDVAASLIVGLLHFDPALRLSAAEALDHPYVSEHRNVATDVFDTRDRCVSLHLQQCVELS